ncbi:MAG: YkgJ family cysteine cluster protein [Capsulimonadaceae bacterium]|nr:YkgJ family cysteine cluster protein [Capsulimonadaceae bacterium]
MSIPLKLITTGSFQRYDCTGCGVCCKGRFAITISKADRDRIVAQKWTDEELDLGGAKLFTKHGDEFVIAHRANGACAFLQDDGLCRIHARYGIAAKPTACRLYPFRLIPAGRQVRVDVRYDCPATAGNDGQPVDGHRRELLSLLKLLTPDQAAELPAPTLFGATSLSWRALVLITESYERLLLDISLPITKRLAACINLTSLLRDRRIAKVADGDFDDFVRALESTVQMAAVEDPIVRRTPLPMEALVFRHVLGVHGRIDRVGEKASLVGRFGASMNLLGGRGMVPRLYEGFPDVSFRDIEAFRYEPSGDTSLTIERYLHTHLISMGFFGAGYYGDGYLDGLNALLLTYPLLLWFARAFAGSEGASTLSPANIERALMVVDHQRGQTPLMNTGSERALARYLGDRNVLRSLAIWYGS